jgi:hypothetical protein
MNTPKTRPSCWTEGPTTPRCDWAFDQGRACANFLDRAGAEQSLRMTPGCRGCSRAERATAIRSGTAPA